MILNAEFLYLCKSAYAKENYARPEERTDNKKTENRKTITRSCAWKREIERLDDLALCQQRSNKLSEELKEVESMINHGMVDGRATHIRLLNEIRILRLEKFLMVQRSSYDSMVIDELQEINHDYTQKESQRGSLEHSIALLELQEKQDMGLLDRAQKKTALLHGRREFELSEACRNIGKQVRRILALKKLQAHQEEFAFQQEVRGMIRRMQEEFREAFRKVNTSSEVPKSEITHKEVPKSEDPASDSDVLPSSENSVVSDASTSAPDDRTVEENVLDAATRWSSLAKSLIEEQLLLEKAVMGRSLLRLRIDALRTATREEGSGLDQEQLISLQVQVEFLEEERRLLLQALDRLITSLPEDIRLICDLLHSLSPEAPPTQEDLDAGQIELIQ